MYRKKKSEALRKNWLFCSRTCSISTKNISRIKFEERDCLFCDKSFSTKTSDKRQRLKKFCSVTCSVLLRNKFNNPAKKDSVKKKLSLIARKQGTAHMQTPAARIKQRKTISGNGHWNWQGGITPENKRRRVHKEAKLWRKAVFERDNYTCQLCFIRGGDLQADHIKPWAISHGYGTEWTCYRHLTQKPA